MKWYKPAVFIAAALLMLTACSPVPAEPDVPAAVITLQDGDIRLDGAAVGTDPTQRVYIAHDIVYYEAGKDFTYGEGEDKDAHTAEEADAHTVVHIAKAGTYRLSGKLTKGQIAVDLGDGAKDDPNAVVTLILDGVDITCEVAPAVIFYAVYECGSTDADKASKQVDTAAAGANVILADGSKNTVNGSYVARIYKPGSVVLNDDGTAVEDAKKLHKYDGAFYSKMSMNIGGQKKGTGSLTIHAANEGLDSELHLTVNGGNLRIVSGNDGINTNEDGVSVTTINGGSLTIEVTGETGEGDGIDSNGWLVINGGTVIASACSNSADGGIDSDMGIHILGGTVIAGGHMLDRIENGGQTYAVFSFAQKQTADSTLCLKNSRGTALMEAALPNAYSILIYSSPDLKAGDYTLWSGDSQLAQQVGGNMGGPGMQGTPPEGMEPPKEGGQEPWGEKPEGQEPPARPPFPEGQRPDGQEPPQKPDRPQDGQGQQGDGREQAPAIGDGETTTVFTIQKGGNMFSRIALPQGE